MPEVLVQTETFNEYVDNIALSAAWSGGLLAIGSGTHQDASPDGSQYVAIGGDREGGVGELWGTAPDLASRTFSGLTPSGSYRVRWQMDIGHSASSTIGGFPAAHSFTAGLQANSVRGLYAIVDRHAPEGLREDAGIPADATEVDYPGVNITGNDICTILGICGWNDYSILTTADGSGHITITFGTFDDRFFRASVYFDNITIWAITEAPPPVPRQRMRPQVFGIGRK